MSSTPWTPNRRSRWLELGLVPIVLLGQAGCDSRPRAYPAKGKVVFADGSPVKMGTVETKSTLHGIQATGAIDRDGSFVLTTYRDGDGAVAGPHDCVVAQFVQAENIANHKPSTVGVVNPKFGSYTTSGLKFQISEKEPNLLVLQVEGIASNKTTEAKSDHVKGQGGHEPQNQSSKGR